MRRARIRLNSTWFKRAATYNARPLPPDNRLYFCGVSPNNVMNTNGDPDRYANSEPPTKPMAPA